MATGATLTRGIRELDRADLEILLARRPEAAELLQRERTPTAVHLASALAGRPGIRRAVESLDLFLLQLLRVASWLGSEVTGTALGAQARGVAPDEIRAGAGELSRWGLAFVGEAPAAHGGWALSVPRAVRVEVPPALGCRAAELLAGEPAESIRAMLLRLGAEPPRPATRESLMALLTARLSDRTALLAILDRAPTPARDVLGAFVSAGGTLTWEAMPRHGVRFGIPSGLGDDSGVGVAWLRQVGLLVVTAASLWQTGAGLSIPGEAQLALRDGVILRDWKPVPPEVVTRPLPPAAGPAGDAAALLSAVQALLDEWAHRPPRAVQKGGAGVRDLRRVAKAIGVDERHGQFLYALAIEAGLLEYRSSSIVPSPAADRWQDQAPPRQWAVLFEAWRGAGLWREPEGLVPMDEAPHTAVAGRRRDAVLRALAELPPGRGAEPAALARLLHWRRPIEARSWHPVPKQQEEPPSGRPGLEGIVKGVAQALAWLGTGVGGSLAALLDPGRSILACPDWTTSAEAAALFPEPVATLTVQPDLTVLVPGRPAPRLSRALACFAEMQASHPARIYRLSEASLRAALDAGMGAAEILDVLGRHSRSAIPQSVAYLVEDVGRQHGRLVLGRGGLFVRSEDPSIIAAVVADRRLVRFRPRALAPTVVAFGESDQDRVLKALRSAGYMPVAEHMDRDPDEDDLDVELGWRAQGRAILYRHPGRGERAALRPDEIARIADAVSRDAARPPTTAASGAPVANPLMDGRFCRTPRDIRRLVELGVQHSAAIEIQYLSGVGETTVRTIEPLEGDRSSVTARCRLRGDRRTFWISRIRWARATGELFEPDIGEPPVESRRAR